MHSEHEQFEVDDIIFSNDRKSSDGKTKENKMEFSVLSELL